MARKVRTSSYYKARYAKMKADPVRYATYLKTQRQRQIKRLEDPIRRAEYRRQHREGQVRRKADPATREKYAQYSKQKWRKIASDPKTKQAHYDKYRDSGAARKQQIADSFDTPEIRKLLAEQPNDVIRKKFPLIDCTVCCLIRRRIYAELQLPSGDWAYVPNTDNEFCISRDGEVRSCGMRPCWVSVPLVKRSRYLAFGCRVYRSDRGRVPTLLSVHQVLLTVFGPPRPTRFHYACHKDDNRDNNALSNLYWGTPRDNALDVVKNHKNKTHIKVATVRAIFEADGTTNDIAKSFKVSRSTIDGIRSGRHYAEFTRDVKGGFRHRPSKYGRFPDKKYILTDEQVVWIRRNAGHISFRAMGEQLKVSSASVHDAAIGHRYCWVTEPVWVTNRKSCAANLPPPLNNTSIEHGSLYDPEHKSPDVSVTEHSTSSVA